MRDRCRPVSVWSRLSADEREGIAPTDRPPTTPPVSRVLVYGARGGRQLKRIQWPRDNDRATGLSDRSRGFPRIQCALMRAFRLDNEGSGARQIQTPASSSLKSLAYTRRQFRHTSPIFLLALRTHCGSLLVLSYDGCRHIELDCQSFALLYAKPGSSRSLSRTRTTSKAIDFISITKQIPLHLLSQQSFFLRVVHFLCQTTLTDQ